MFHIDRTFCAQRRQVGAANVCMERTERLSENGFIRGAASPSIRWERSEARSQSHHRSDVAAGGNLPQVDFPYAPGGIIISAFQPVMRFPSSMSNGDYLDMPTDHRIDDEEREPAQ
jgi:hypothetical protein